MSVLNINEHFRREVMIFDGINFEIRNATKNNYIDIFQICLVNKDHYDVIYKKDYIVTAGFCQCKRISLSNCYLVSYNSLIRSNRLWNPL